VPQLNIDCEGPITQNDNAFELCEAFIPRGGDLFARVSRYDDYLADVEQRAGYKAGDTLRLVLPFLKAFGVTNAKMEEFSRRTLVLLPDAQLMLATVTGLMPTYIISTSYRPYLDALCGLTGFPPDQVYCTGVDLNRYEINDRESRRLAVLVEELLAAPVLSWPERASGRGDLADRDLRTLERLDAVFWEEIPEMGIGRVLEEVDPVGGSEKAKAVLDSLTRTGNALADVFYVGDSITDAQALDLVGQAGGVALSFNGNRYAVRKAGWACVSGSTAIIGALAGLLCLAGASALEGLLPPGTGASLRGQALLERLETFGVRETLLAPLRRLDGLDALEIDRVEPSRADGLIGRSESMRRSVRGTRVAMLG